MDPTGVNIKYLTRRFWYGVVVKIREAEGAGESSEQWARLGVSSAWPSPSLTCLLDQTLWMEGGKGPISLWRGRWPGDPGRQVATCHDGKTCVVGPVAAASEGQRGQLPAGRLQANFFILLHFTYPIYKTRIIIPALKVMVKWEIT